MPARHFEVADQESEPVTFGYKGETYRCRGEAPALPVLRGMKAQLTGTLGQEAQAGVVIELLESVFEDGELDRLLRTGIGLSALFSIAGNIMAIYQGKDIAEGEAMPPVTGAPTNSESFSNAST